MNNTETKNTIRKILASKDSFKVGDIVESGLGMRSEIVDIGKIYLIVSSEDLPGSKPQLRILEKSKAKKLALKQGFTSEPYKAKVFMLDISNGEGAVLIEEGPYKDKKMYLDPSSYKGKTLKQDQSIKVTVYDNGHLTQVDKVI